MRITLLLLMGTFFLSGCAALIYQLVWQRYLFTGLGVDIDSVTLIVSSFMLGIGIGGACGGVMADRWSEKRVLIYGVAELGLAIFGVLSPIIFGEIQNLGGYGWTYANVSIISVFVLLIPTVMMGSTLPILTMHFDEIIENVGVSVGRLYFFNTLGAAFGAWFAAWIGFELLGLGGSIWVAAFLNFSCFLCVFLINFFELGYKKKGG